MLKNIRDKHPSIDRYIAIPLILFFTIPPIMIIGFGGEIGSYIGMSFYIIIGGYGMFEVFKNLNISKTSAVILGLSIISLFLMPWDQMKSFASFSTYSPSFSYYINWLFDWKSILVFIAILFSVVAIDPIAHQDKKFVSNLLIVLVTGIIIAFFAKGVWIINNFDWRWVFFFIPIAIIADTFGYFGGMLFGKKWFRGAKLAPKLSPKKTWAGFIIGYVFTAFFIGFVGWYMHIFANSQHEIIFLVVATLLIPIVSPMGDLLFSGIKRFLGIKDFSDLLPGHGGILDRVDAMSVVVFTFILLFLIF